MDSEDTLYGRIKNGVLTLPGNNASIRVDGGGQLHKESLAGWRGLSLKVCLRSAGLAPPCRCCPPPGEHGKGCNHPYRKPASSAGER